MTTVAERILTRMTDAGIPASRVAEAVGVSPGFFSDLRTGRKKSVNAELIPAIAAALGVPPGYLLGIQDPRTATEPSSTAIVLGSINLKAWFVDGDDAWQGREILAHLDRRYPPHEQLVFINTGDEVLAGGKQIPEGAVVFCHREHGALRSGDLAVAEETKDGFTRRFMGVITDADGSKIRCCDSREYTISDLTICGRVTRIVQVF